MQDETSSHSFVLNVNYGLSRPNKMGFADGDKILTIHGTYMISYQKSEIMKGEVCYLISKGFSGDTMSLLKLDNHLLHILQPDISLMIGNGGWSYTLNRRNSG